MRALSSYIVLGCSKAINELAPLRPCYIRLVAILKISLAAEFIKLNKQTLLVMLVRTPILFKGIKMAKHAANSREAFPWIKAVKGSLIHPLSAMTLSRC